MCFYINLTLLILLETLKYDQHKTSSYFQDKTTKCNVFEIPQFSENRCSIPKRISQSSSKKTTNKENLSSNEIHTRKKSLPKTPTNSQKLQRINNKTKEIAINTNETSYHCQSTQVNVCMIDESTQTNPNDFEESERDETSAFTTKNQISISKDLTMLKNNENQKTILNSNSVSSEIDNSCEKKRLNKFEIENLFKSVKNMIIGVKEKENTMHDKSRMSSFQSSFLSKHLDIQNLKDSTDHLIQKLENIKRSKDEGNLKQSLQSSDFMLSRSETFLNGDMGSNFNNNLPQKASNLIESKLIDSCFSTGNNQNQNVNEFNITKSIDFIEKMLSSQVFGNQLATKESKFSNNIGLSNIENTDDPNFINESDNECELFQSHFLASCKNIFEDPNNTNNFPVYYIGSQKPQDKIMVYDQENLGKNNNEIMEKYGSGIEKIDERAEEFINWSPNSKNNFLKFNSKKLTPENILKEKNNKILNVSSSDSSNGNLKIIQDESGI